MPPAENPKRLPEGGGGVGAGVVVVVVVVEVVVVVVGVVVVVVVVPDGGGGGDEAATTVVGSEVAVAEPLWFVATTTMRSVFPTSLAVTACVDPASPEIALQAAPVVSQPSHW